MTANASILADLENEQDVIGVLLKDDDAFASMAYLKPYHFWEPVHQRVMAAMTDIRARGQRVSLGAVKAALRGDAGLVELDRVAPNGDYLAKLWSKFCAVSYAQQVATVIVDDWMRRQTVEIAENVVLLATGDNARPALDVLSYLRNSADELARDTVAADGDFQSASEVADKTACELADNLRNGRTLGKKVGLRCIDRRQGGLMPGELIVLAGRPAMGKTALGGGIARGFANRNPKDRAAFFCMEMAPREISFRQLSAITHDLGDGVEYRDMMQGTLTPHDLANVQRAKDCVPSNLILIDCPGLGLDELRRKVWSLKRKGPLGLVVVDYLQLMYRGDARNRTEASLIGDITKGLKQLARQAGCTILLLSQLSRQVETREDKRPQLSDLRESGNIEQDADFVMFVYRESYYLEKAKPPRGKETEHDMEVMRLQNVMEVITGKARRAPPGTDLQRYVAAYDHVSDPE